MTYDINLTRLAVAIAETRYSKEDVLNQARKELDDLDLEDPTKIMLHCFRMPGVKDMEFICLPRDGGIVVDTFTYDEGETLDKGPFRGKRMMMPRPDSSED